MRVNRVTGDIEAVKIQVQVSQDKFQEAVCYLGGHQETLPMQGERVLEVLTGLEVDGANWVRVTRDAATDQVLVTMGSTDV